MRYLGMLVVVLFVSVLSGAALAADSNVAEFPVGNATVWAVADAVADRNMNVFAGVDYNVITQYVPSGATPSATMTFLIKLGDEMILLDTGNGNSQSQLLAGLEQVGVTPEQITLILISHMHGDHIGGMVKDGAKVFPSARVMASKVESDFWLDPASVERFPDRRSGFEMCRDIFALYDSVYETFEFGAEVVPGLKALDSRGHTPGHTSFLLESNGEKMLLWGDLAHAAAIQFPRPDLNARYDMVPVDAIASRTRFMEMAAVEKLTIAGVHLPFPAVGTVEKNPEGGYLYISR